MVWWIRSGPFISTHILLFLLVSTVLYFKPFTNPSKFFFAFLALIALVFVIPSILLWGWLVAIGFGFIFFILMGSKEFVFFEKRNWHYFTLFSLIACLNGLFLLKRYGFIIQPILFITFFVLFIESYGILIEKISRYKKILVAGISAFVSMEMLWIGLFIPMNFSQSAACITLIIFFLQDITVLHFHEMLSREVIVRNIGILIAFSALIFFVA
ncbi:MAG: hypothetical protein V1652_01945 [bacterium]